MQRFGSDGNTVTLYHGTTSDCITSLKRGILVGRRGSRTPDFGPGFYATTNYQQAVKWSRYKQDRNTNKKARPVVMKYTLNLNGLSKMNLLDFGDPGVRWTEFIYGNRMRDREAFNNLDAKFDVVFGPIGDGFRMARELRRIKQLKQQTGKFQPDEFQEFLISKDHPFPEYNQISFHTQRAVELLTWKAVDFI